ncbi:MAG: hypothetical protein RSA15_04160 [Bacilli bacterium]
MKRLFIFILGIISIILNIENVEAKEMEMECYYDRTLIHSFTQGDDYYAKVKIVVNDDKSVEAFAIGENGSTYSDIKKQTNVTYFDFDGKVSNYVGSNVQQLIFYKKGYSKFFDLYNTNKECPNLVIKSQINTSTELTATNETSHEGELWISKPTRNKKGGGDFEKPEDNLYVCPPIRVQMNVESKYFWGIKEGKDGEETNFYFGINKKNGKLYFALTLYSTDPKISKYEYEFDRNGPMSYKVQRNLDRFEYLIDNEDVKELWKDIKSDNSSFTCPNILYGGLTKEADDESNSNEHPVMLTSKIDKLKDTDFNTISETGITEKDKFSIFKKKDSNIDVSISLNKTGCKQILGQELLDWLQWVLDIIRIAGLVLTIVFGIVDFMSASFSSKEDGMKTATKNFSTRLMSLAIIFLVPVIIEFTLGLLNIASTGDNPTCGLN